MQGPSHYPAWLYFADQPTFCLGPKEYAELVEKHRRHPRGYEPKPVAAVKLEFTEAPVPEAPVTETAEVSPESDPEQATRQAGQRRKKVTKNGEQP